jgi:alanine racemase
MRPTVADINLGAIHHNLTVVRKKIGKHPRIMAVVKANAYGHGIIDVAKSVLKEKKADYLGVAIIEEGVELRNEKIVAPILSFTAPFDEQLDLFLRYGIDCTICTMATARRLNALAQAVGIKAVVHVKVDTGMGRIGIPANEATSFIESLLAMPFLELKGIYTHFATSDEARSPYAMKQLRLFTSVVNSLRSHNITIPIVHCANSGAIIQFPESYFDMVRPGIMMYGYAPSPSSQRRLQLQPALSLHSRISFLKTVEKGSSISYGRRYITPRKTKIASIPIGYADGLNRDLTNKISVLIREKKYPVVGTICMDQVMVDLGLRSDVDGEERVTFLGPDGKRSISAWDYSKILGTIPYEICCAISARVPRNYHNG